MVTTIKHKTLAITGHLYRLGTGAFPAYLSLGTDAMIIEGGIGATFQIILGQIEELGIDPGRIKYVALTHSHSDHIGALPHFKKLWPHLEVLAGPVTAASLENDDAVKAAATADDILTRIMLEKREINAPPPPIGDRKIHVDRIIKENDVIDLGMGISWQVIETPGHSPCHTSFFEKKEKIAAIGDAAGFYSPEKDIFWPNYFDSLGDYCRSIKKLRDLPAQIGVLSHNHIEKKNVPGFLNKALLATQGYHTGLLERVSVEGKDKFVAENAAWVNTLTTDHPLEIMVSLSKLLVKRSLSESAVDFDV